jgi:hypothetical protein
MWLWVLGEKPMEEIWGSYATEERVGITATMHKFREYI